MKKTTVIPTVGRTVTTPEGRGVIADGRGTVPASHPVNGGRHWVAVNLPRTWAKPARQVHVFVDELSI